MSGTDILRSIYLDGVRERVATQRSVAGTMGKPKNVGIAIHGLVDAGLVKRKGSELSLTPKGRKRLKVVLIGGAFEIVHPGHLYTIRQARQLGDVLVVVVATDRTVTRNKGREPVTDEATRVDLVSAIRDVDLAILGNQGSIYDTLEKVRPDIVALGYDQRHSAEEIVEEGKRRGIEVETRRLTTLRPDMKTTKILAEFR